MKKLLIALLLGLSAMTYAQQSNAGQTAKFEGIISNPAYSLPGAPVGVSSWMVDFTTVDGKAKTQGVSETKAAELNKLLALNDLKIVAYRTQGGGEQGDSIQVIETLPKK